MNSLKDKKIAILSENGFEESELTSPKKALEDAGAKVYIVSPQKEVVKGWKHDKWTIELPVDMQVSNAYEKDFDALVIPGGVINPDLMRRDQHCINFAKSFFTAGKTVAAICHAPQLLVETEQLHGITMTSFPSVKKDMQNAGANWIDEEVVYDKNLITSRSPADLDAFNKKIIEVLAAV